MRLKADGSDRGRTSASGDGSRGDVEAPIARSRRFVRGNSAGIWGEIARATAIEARTLAVDVARGSPRASTVLSGSNFLTSSSAMASSRIRFANRATVSARHVAILLRRLVAAKLSRIPPRAIGGRYL